MSEEHPNRVPSSEEVSRALRRCWQPVARVQDLEHGPQRAVLLGEALAVFLTESGAPAVVADRCAHRGASLSMGEVVGEGVQCPYHGWEWDGRDGACTRIPSLADQGQIPPRARIAAFPVREQWGLVWTALEEPLGEPPSVPWFDPSPSRLGARDAVRAAGRAGRDDRELPRRRPLRLRPQGDARRGPRGDRAACGRARRARGDDAPRDEAGDGGDGTWESSARRPQPRDRPQLHLDPDAHGERRALAAARGAGDQRDRVGALLDRGAERGLRRAQPRGGDRVRGAALRRGLQRSSRRSSRPSCRSLSMPTSAPSSDRFTLAYREAFAEFVRRALRAPLSPARRRAERCRRGRSGGRTRAAARAWPPAPGRTGRSAPSGPDRRPRRRPGRPPHSPKKVCSIATVSRVSSSLPGLIGGSSRVASASATGSSQGTWAIEE